MATRAFALFACVLTLTTGAGATELIAPSSVRPGARGVCVTEVEEGVLLEIPLRVLGVLEAVSPEREIVLVRLEHERFEEVGVAAGMSGSPVYVDGRLLGALAFGWDFASEPVAGVTPFTRMQTSPAGELPPQSIAAARVRPELGEILTALAGGDLAEMVVDWLAPAAREGALPMAVGGLGASVGDGGWPAAAARRMGWIVTPAGGQTAAGPATPVRPGSMVAAVLVNGDGQLAAGGTVTEVREGRAWAFGHPFLGAGSIRLPLARAGVVTILPSLASSFKVFNVGAVIGTVTSDRTHGIVAELGQGPPLVPLEVATADRVYHFGIADHPLLSPLLTGFMVYASHAVRGRTFGLQTVAVRLRAELGDALELDLDQVFEGIDAPAQSAAWTSAVLGYVAASPFGPAEVRSLSVDLDVREGLHGATILDVTPDRRVVVPGDPVGVRVRLRHEGGDVESVTLSLQVPPETPAGRLDLVVADGASWTAYDLAARPTVAASLEDEVGLLQRLGSARRIVAALERPGTSLVLPGGTVAAPPGLVTLLQSALGEGLRTVAFRLVARTDAETQGPVLGAARIRLEVRRRGGWEGVS